MKTIFVAGALALVSAVLLPAQIGKTFDWYTAAGDNQRTGWEKSDTKFTKDQVKDFSLALKMKLEGKGKGSNYLMPPVVLGTLVGYRGFKELGFVANGVGDVWAIDVDLDTVYWERHLDLPKTKKASGACPAGSVSQPTMEPGATFGGRRKKGVPALSTAAFYKKIFAPRTLYVLAIDGNLYRLDTSTGKDMTPPVTVMPPGADVSDLNASEGVIYATTSNSCGEAPNAVWQVTLSGGTPKVASFPSPAPEGFVGPKGLLLGSDDQIYAQTGNTLQILSPTDLQPQQTFSGALGNISPVAFLYKDNDMLVTAGKNGSLYLLNSTSINTAVSQTAPITVGEDAKIVGLSTWETAEGTRWVLAAVEGASVDAPTAPHGSIVAFQLSEDNGKPDLKHIWTSQDLAMPETPVIANGVVFALSAGEAGKKGKLGGHAVLYALDGETGKEMWSTHDQVTAPANLSGLTIANGRVFFTTTDSTLYAFGYHLEN
jgi:hypothetical protein